MHAMMTVSTFSEQTRPTGSDIKKKATGFLDLPAEIRNKIYDLAFEQRAVLLRRGKSNKCNHQYLYPVYVSKPFLPDREEPSPYHKKIDTAFMFTCKIVYDEALPMFYSKMAFGFNTAKAVRRFLTRTPKRGIAAIQYIGIHQRAYGEPEQCTDVAWKWKSDQSWVRLYHTIGKEMIGLRFLVLGIQVRTWPATLNLNETWAITARQLGVHKFVEVNITVYHPLISVRQREKAAMKLEGELRMLPEEWVKHIQQWPLAEPGIMTGDLFYTLRNLLGYAWNGPDVFPDPAATVDPQTKVQLDLAKKPTKATKILRMVFSKS